MPSYPTMTAPTRNGTHKGFNGAASGKYGAANRFDFDNPSKWVTVPDVKVLDEHELDGEDGKPAAYVDRSVLEEIAANNNNRVLATGDPAPLIVGHTSDDPQAPERPVVGYAVNYKVKESRDATGKVSYAIHTDYKVRPDKEHVIEDFPRRSVELWLGRRELDPIALLGGTTPERDLGVIIRKSRISGFTLDRTVSRNGTRSLERNEGPVLQYSKKRGQVIRYAMKTDECGDDDESMNYSHGENTMKTMKGKSVKAPGGPVKTKHSYEADPDNEMATDDLPPDMSGSEDDTDIDMGGGEEQPDPAGEDPAIAAIFQSKAFGDMLTQALRTALPAALEELLAQEEGGGAGGPAPAPSPGGAMPPGGGMDGPPPQGTDGLAPQPEEEARIDHEAPPVRFGANTGFAGPGSANIPAVGGKQAQPYQRSSQPMTRTQPRQQAARQNPEVVRLSRQLADQNKTIKDLLIRNARIEAEKIVTDFENNAEGHEDGPVVFGDRDQEIEVLTNMDPRSREYHIENIRVNYRRAGYTNGPTDSRNVDQLFRHSRTDDGGKPVTDEDYVPQTAAEAVALADAQSGRFSQGQPMTYGQAVKYMRDKAQANRQQQGRQQARR